jgi:hypothetical protein
MPGLVIPAKAGIHFLMWLEPHDRKWIPAFAGMTARRCVGVLDGREMETRKAHARSSGNRGADSSSSGKDAGSNAGPRHPGESRDPFFDVARTSRSKMDSGFRRNDGETLRRRP